MLRRGDRNMITQDRMRMIREQTVISLLMYRDQLNNLS